MNAKRIFLGLLTATVVLTPLATLNPASARTITTANPKADLIARGGSRGGQITIDPVQLGFQIEQEVVAAKNRAGFVKGAMEQAAFQAKKGGYNVMVFNMSQDYDTDIRNTAKFFKQVNYHGVPYGIWIFKKGKFTNKGDAGWINWAMYGNFTRNGKTVTFH